MACLNTQSSPLVAVRVTLVCGAGCADACRAECFACRGGESGNGNERNRSHIILDEKTGTIIGVVSEKYVGYSNDAFLKNGDYSIFPEREREIQRISDAIAALPFCLGNRESLTLFRSHWRDSPSMYDFVNIFTEHAKGLPNGQKIEVESRAGSLASWIAENSKGLFENSSRTLS